MCGMLGVQTVGISKMKKMIAQVNSRVYTESAEQIKSPVNFKADSVSTGLLRISLL